MIAAFLGHDGQQRQFSGAVQLFGEITVENVGAPCMAGILQPADGLHGLARWENMPIRIGWRGVGDRKRSSTDLCRGELAIEGGAVGRRAPVVGFRVARPAGFCRPTKPVVGARQRNRVVGDFGNPCKVHGRRSWIVQASQRIPPRMEFRVDRVRRSFRGVLGGDAVGGLHVTGIDKLARQRASFDPPCVGVYQRRLVPWRLRHQRGRLREFLVSTQVPGFGKQVAGAALRGRNRVQKLARFLVSLDDGNPGVGERLRAGKPRDTLCRRHALGIEHTFHSIAVIGGRDELAEFPDDRRFIPRCRAFPCARGATARRAPWNGPRARRARAPG